MLTFINVYYLLTTHFGKIILKKNLCSFNFLCIFRKFHDNMNNENSVVINCYK